MNTEAKVKTFYPEAKTALYTTTFERSYKTFGSNCLLVHTVLSETKWYRVIAGKWLLSEPCPSKELAWEEALTKLTTRIIA